jgi:hypothetical protein
MEQELIRNTEGMLDRKLGDFKQAEADGLIPTMIIGSTIMNDGRKLLMSAQPVSYLTQPEYSLRDSIFPKPIDGVDFATLFEKQNPYNLRLTTALRMNATFPLVLPVVKMPSRPEINLMDVGLRDNFGVEVATRYLHVFRDWISANTRRVIYLQIRDTREYEVFPMSNQNSLGRMLADPIFIIQNKWEPFQSYVQGYLKDYAPWFLDGNLEFVTLQYIPEEEDQLAALNFHLTQREKQDLYRSVQDEENQAAIRALIKLLE